MLEWLIDWVQLEWAFLGKLVLTKKNDFAIDSGKWIILGRVDTLKANFCSEYIFVAWENYVLARFLWELIIFHRIRFQIFLQIPPSKTDGGFSVTFWISLSNAASSIAVVNSSLKYFNKILTNFKKIEKF